MKSRRRQIVNPDIGLAVRMRRARMQTSATAAESAGPLPPHHGRLATRAGEAVRTEAVSHPSSFACGIRHRFRPGRSPGTRRLERRPGALRPVTTTIASRLRQVRLTRIGPRQPSDRAAACPSDANEPSTDRRFAALVPTEPDRPFAHRHHLATAPEPRRERRLFHKPTGTGLGSPAQVVRCVALRNRMGHVL